MATRVAIQGKFDLLPRPSSCAPNATFVTLIANESYVAGALCLRRSLERVGSVCPLVLVIADPLPTKAMAQLTAGFSGSRIRRLSEMRERLDHHKAAGRRLQQLKLKSTRQLARAGGWARRTHQKLLLFALDGYERAAFLDIDMLIARNVDALLDHPPFAAVAALPYEYKKFNSGVFVYAPSLADAAALDDLSQRATFDGKAASAAGRIRIRGAGERFELSDQSILNHHFKGRWTQLPFGYNMGVKTRSVNRKLWAKVPVAVVHFVHRPKPWEPSLAEADSPMTQLARRMGIEVRGGMSSPQLRAKPARSIARRAHVLESRSQPLVRAWRFHCAGEGRGNTTLSKQDALLFA